MNKIKIEVPKNHKKLENQMRALEWQIERDTNDKDRVIHQEALEELKAALKESTKTE